MKIRMLCSISGTWIAGRGEVVDRPEAEALRLINAGIAEAVEPASPRKAPSAKPASEKAVASRANLETRTES